MSGPRAAMRPDGHGDRPDDASEYSAAMRATADLHAAASRCTDLDELLQLILARLSEAVGAKRSGVWLRKGDVFVGRAAHPAAELQAAVSRMTVGGPLDTFTRAVVMSGEPVLIRDVRSDSGAAQGRLRTWRVRSILGIPMLDLDDVVGVIFMDNADEPHPYRQVHVDVAAAMGRIAGVALAQLDAAAKLRTQADTTTRQTQLLRSLATADARFTEILFAGGGLRAIAQVLGEMTRKPVALYDAGLRRVTPAPRVADDGEVRLLEDATDRHAVVEALEKATSGSTVIGPLMEAGVRRRHLVAPIDGAGDRWGWVVLTEHTSRLNAFDELSIRSAARWASLDLVADRRGTMASWDARAMLARQLIDGTQDEDARRSADRLAIELDRPRVVAFVTAPGQGGDAIDARSLVAALADRVDGDVLVTKDADGVAVLADVAGDAQPLVAIATAKSQIEAACGEVAEGLVAGLSTVCRTARGLTRAYAEARDVARCIDRFAVTATPRVLAADDLGPARLFVANADAGAMDRFVKDLIGPLLDGDSAMTDLLRTLQAFFEAGRSVRDAGARLGIHPNTVRYRLGRVQALTGLDAADNSDDQLSIQMSLLVLRLQGHFALPSFERAP